HTWNPESGSQHSALLPPSSTYRLCDAIPELVCERMAALYEHQSQHSSWSVPVLRRGLLPFVSRLPTNCETVHRQPHLALVHQFPMVRPSSDVSLQRNDRAPRASVPKDNPVHRCVLHRCQSLLAHLFFQDK